MINGYKYYPSLLLLMKDNVWRQTNVSCEGLANRTSKSKTLNLLPQRVKSKSFLSKFKSKSIQKGPESTLNPISKTETPVLQLQDYKLHCTVLPYAISKTFQLSHSHHTITLTYRDVKRSSNFRTLILKFEFDLHTFSIRSSDWNLDRDALPMSRTLRYKLLI